MRSASTHNHHSSAESHRSRVLRGDRRSPIDQLQEASGDDDTNEKERDDQPGLIDAMSEPTAASTLKRLCCEYRDHHCESYLIHSRHSPSGGIVGPAFRRSLLSIARVTSSALMRHLPTSTSVPAMIRTML